MGKTYVSKLAPFMEAFIEFKHSLGLPYQSGEYQLRKFDRYCAETESEVTSLKEIIKNWVVLRDSESPDSQRLRVAPIREFGKFLRSAGYADAYVIPQKVCQKQIRIMPHFFTNEKL
jgi:hypothetical protein